MTTCFDFGTVFLPSGIFLFFMRLKYKAKPCGLLVEDKLPACCRVDLPSPLRLVPLVDKKLFCSVPGLSMLGPFDKLISVVRLLELTGISN